MEENDFTCSNWKTTSRTPTDINIKSKCNKAQSKRKFLRHKQQNLVQIMYDEIVGKRTVILSRHSTGGGGGGRKDVSQHRMGRFPLEFRSIDNGK